MRTQYLIVFSIMSLLPAISLADEHTLTPANAQRVKTIQSTVRKDLGAGNTQHAKSELEQAMNNFHAVQLELGMVQTLMQAGEYRHALSAAAHTQAEHPNALDSTLLYAWLLALGGQSVPATQLLETTLKTAGNKDDSKTLQILLTQIKQQQLNNQTISADLTDDDIQLYPYSETSSDSPKLKHISNGVVVGNGTQVITALPAQTNNTTFWVRNGLGRVAKAEIKQTFPQQNLALLKLAKPLINTSATQFGATPFAAKIAKKTPYPGTPFYLSEYRLTQPEQANWPVLKIDILGMPSENNGYQTHLTQTYAGSPAYNAAGELIGVISATKPLIMPVSSLLSSIQTDITQSSPSDSTSSKQNNSSSNPLFNNKLMDELYEETLSTSVQVLIE